MSEKRLLVLVFNSVVLASFLATVILVSIASAKMYIPNYGVKLRIDNEFGRNPYGVFLWNCISLFGDVPVFSQLLLWIVSGVSLLMFIFPGSDVVVCVSLQATQQYIAGS